MQVYLKENSRLAWLAARWLRSKRMAIVFRKTIHLWNVGGEAFLQDTGWVCHELTHIQQYQRYGTWRFVLRYLTESIKKGYARNRYEAEAIQMETDSSILQGVEFVRAGRS